MIDWHSHILPKMDDGSRDETESTVLIEMQATQGVDTVIATPHFYANDETVATFLDRRRESLARLREALTDVAPTILVGAEVRYYQGISRLPDLKALCIEGSNLLLLEMPMCRWTETMIRELIEMSAVNGLSLVLAHVERYRRLQSRDVWARLLDSGIRMQVNATYIISRRTRHTAIALFRKGQLHFVGSDCHSVRFRPPRIGEAFGILRKRLGEQYVSRILEYGQSVLSQNKQTILKG